MYLLSVNIPVISSPHAVQISFYLSVLWSLIKLNKPDVTSFWLHSLWNELFQILIWLSNPPEIFGGLIHSNTLKRDVNAAAARSSHFRESHALVSGRSCLKVEPSLPNIVILQSKTRFVFSESTVKMFRSLSVCWCRRDDFFYALHHVSSTGSTLIPIFERNKILLLNQAESVPCDPSWPSWNHLHKNVNIEFYHEAISSQVFWPKTDTAG